MIVRSNPPTGLELVDQAWFDSDAEENAQAIREIDTEAAKYNLVRTREYWLQTFTLPDGQVVRRGFCYRPEKSGVSKRLAQRRQNDKSSLSSSEIVRQMRDAEA